MFMNNFLIEVDEYDLINDGTFWFCEREEEKRCSICVLFTLVCQSKPVSS